MRFYTGVLGMEEQTCSEGHRALRFGRSKRFGQFKINLHHAAPEVEPASSRPAAGNADLCLIVADPLDAVMAELTRLGVPSSKVRWNGPARAGRSSAYVCAIRTRTW